MSEVIKICKHCLDSKEASEFNKQTRAKDGLKSICKQCDKILNAKRYALKKQSIILQVKDWQRNNVEKVKQIKNNYYVSKKKSKKITKDNLSSQNSPIVPTTEVSQSVGVVGQSSVA